MKTKIENLTLLDVNEHLDIIAKSESIMCQSALIYSDMCISLNTFNEQFKGECKPREWYFAIRLRGTEAGENKERVKERCRLVGEPHIVIKVEYNSETESYTMTINRN